MEIYKDVFVIVLVNERMHDVIGELLTDKRMSIHTREPEE